MSFEVEFVIVSDYAAQSIDGKWIVAGIYPAEIIFSSEPAKLPTFSMTLCLKPLKPKFDFIVEFISPENQKVFEFEAQHVAQTIQQTSRVMLQIPMPPVVFPGVGEYKLVVRTLDSTVRIEKLFLIRVGVHDNQGMLYQAKVDITRMEAASR